MFRFFKDCIYHLRNISYEDLQSFVQISDDYDLNSIDCYFFIIIQRVLNGYQI